MGNLIDSIYDKMLYGNSAERGGSTSVPSKHYRFKITPLGFPFSSVQVPRVGRC